MKTKVAAKGTNGGQLSWFSFAWATIKALSATLFGKAAVILTGVCLVLLCPPSFKINYREVVSANSLAMQADSPWTWGTITFEPSPYTLREWVLTGHPDGDIGVKFHVCDLLLQAKGLTDKIRGKVYCRTHGQEIGTAQLSFCRNFATLLLKFADSEKAEDLIWLRGDLNVRDSSGNAAG